MSDVIIQLAGQPPIHTTTEKLHEHANEIRKTLKRQLGKLERLTPEGGIPMPRDLQNPGRLSPDEVSLIEGDVQKEKTRMKDTDADRAVRDAAYRVSADELRQIVETIEALEAEKAEATEQIKDRYAEAKGRGYDTKALRKIVQLRRQDADARAEEQAVLDIYMSALGMT